MLQFVILEKGSEAVVLMISCSSSARIACAPLTAYWKSTTFWLMFLMFIEAFLRRVIAWWETRLFLYFVNENLKSTP